MRKIIITTFIILTLLFSLHLHAAYLKNIPVTVHQPNGEIVKCFASGDEFFNYLHDEDGYTIVQHPTTGYYVYAIQGGISIVPSEMIVGTDDPRSLGITPHLTLSPQLWEMRRTARYSEIANNRPEINYSNENRNHGTINNLVVFIRFSGESNLSTSFSTVDNMFNDSTTITANSMYNFFKVTSYQNLFVSSTYYPAPSGNTILSYQDIYTRDYYSPYHAVTNPDGYETSGERTSREHALLGRAVNYVSSSVPSSLNIDYNNDGYVDNICFVVKGDVDGWSDLLWPHRWALYSDQYFINSKQVYDYNFMLEGATSYFNTAVLSHEMSHTLSFPDLYHYGGDNLTPVGPWDVMASTASPAQQPSAYTKWRYGNWIDEISTIEEAGTYTITSVATPEGTKCYAIPTQSENEYIIIEYRNNDDTFENVPSSGVVIYRVNTQFSGNASYDGVSTFDEVYIFRPSGTLASDGDLINAHFGVAGRTSFNESTVAYPFLTDGTLINDLQISNITFSGDSASFTIVICNLPAPLVVTDVTTTEATFNFSASLEDTVTCQFVYAPAASDANPDELIPQTGHSSNFPMTLINLNPITTYNFWYRTDCGDGNYTAWEILNFTTLCGNIVINQFPWNESFENGINCWSQQHIQGTLDWTLRNTPTATNLNAQDGSAYVSFFGNENTGSRTRLISPTIDLTGRVNPYITFYYAQPVWGADQNTITVLYRTAPNAEWIELISYTESATSWTFDSITLPSPSETYQIAFEGHDLYGYNATVDNITVMGTSYACGAPESLAATNVTSQSIQLEWDNTQSYSEQYTIRYREEGVSPWQMITVDYSSQYILTQLEENVTYQIQVRAHCEETELNYWVPETPLHVTTENRQFLISAYSYGPGSINPSGNIQYDEGATPTYTFTPNSGAYIDSVVVSSIEVDVQQEYTFAPLASDETIEVFFKMNPTSVNNNIKDNNISLYPNPTSSNITILSDNNQIESVEIIDVTGKILLTPQIIHSTEVSVPVDLLQAGIYFARVSTSLGISSIKFILIE